MAVYYDFYTWYGIIFILLYALSIFYYPFGTKYAISAPFLICIHTYLLCWSASLGYCLRSWHDDHPLLVDIPAMSGGYLLITISKSRYGSLYARCIYDNAFIYLFHYCRKKMISVPWLFKNFSINLPPFISTRFPDLS